MIIENKVKNMFLLIQILGYKMFGRWENSQFLVKPAEVTVVKKTIVNNSER